MQVTPVPTRPRASPETLLPQAAANPPRIRTRRLHSSRRRADERRGAVQHQAGNVRYPFLCGANEGGNLALKAIPREGTSPGTSTFSSWARKRAPPSWHSWFPRGNTGSRARNTPAKWSAYRTAQLTFFHSKASSSAGFLDGWTPRLATLNLLAALPSGRVGGRARAHENIALPGVGAYVGVV